MPLRELRLLPGPRRGRPAHSQGAQRPGLGARVLERLLLRWGGGLVGMGPGRARQSCV